MTETVINTMYDQHLKPVLEEIKSLKIQGATNVAIEGVQAFSIYAQDVFSAFKNNDEYLKHLYSRSKEVKQVRITEPALANGLNYLLSQIELHGNTASVAAGETYKKILHEAKKSAAIVGAELVQEDSTVMTHCHSSFVNEILWQAKELGRKFRVVNTETRPLFQGRKTVRKLREKDIEVIHVVDSAMWWAMDKFDVDVILTGADAVTVEGVALNKIGSRLLALSARELHVPLYICTSLLKYNSETALGRRSQIEMRESAEIWPDHPEGVEVFNPAFETIASHYISAYVTEYGLIPPQMMDYNFETKIKNGIFKL